MRLLIGCGVEVNESIFLLFFGHRLESPKSPVVVSRVSSLPSVSLGVEVVVVVLCVDWLPVTFTRQPLHPVITSLITLDVLIASSRSNLISIMGNDKDQSPIRVIVRFIYVIKFIILLSRLLFYY